MTIFLDANIILDLIDNNRGRKEETKELLKNFLSNGDTLYTSCDIFTTVYYVASKRVEQKVILNDLDKILQIVNIIPIDLTIIQKAMALVKENSGSDLEDVLQYVCALHVKADVIVTNDKKFYQGEIEVRSTLK